MRHKVFSILFSTLIFSSLGLNAQVGFIQKGEASYYASQFHGRPTASGERYNKNLLTASHKKLAFGTKLKVTNLANNKTIVVRINDRGPYVPRRIIDVSLAAAKELDMLRAGLAPVKIEVIETGDGSTTPQGVPESSQRETPERESPRDENGSEVVLPQDDMGEPEYADNSADIAEANETEANETEADETEADEAEADEAETVDDHRSDVQKGVEFEEGEEALEEASAVVYQEEETVEPAENNNRTRLSAWAVGGTFSGSGTQHFPSGYTIQVGAFGAKQNAQRKIRELSNRGFEDAYIQVIRSGNGVLYKVVVGAYGSEAQARRLQDQLTEARFYGFLSKHLR